VASAWIKSGDFVMDVGANHGQHARLFAQMVGTNGRVLCFEADPFICESLTKGAADSLTPITVENVALGDFEFGNEILFYRHKLRDQEGSIFQRETSDKYESIAVAGRKLDDFVHENPTFVKVDVEGAEYEILKGAKNILKLKSPLVGIELTRFPDLKMNYNPIDFLQILEELEYDIFNILGEQVTQEKWFDENFFMNHQNWLAKRGTFSHSFCMNQIPKLCRAFSWGATNNVPYPFKLIDFPS
jgi:FkbM family methyltransferase